MGTAIAVRTDYSSYCRRPQHRSPVHAREAEHGLAAALGPSYIYGHGLSL
jgi:hypothetical protein